MINFEEELKKFGPSMEIEEVESAVRGHELTDMTDIMLNMMREKEAAQAAGTIPTPTAAPAMTAAPTMTATQPMPTIPSQPLV